MVDTENQIIKNIYRKIKTRLGQLTLFYRMMFWKCLDGIWYKIKRQTDIMYAYYDLQVSAPTFDFIVFLVLAEQARIEARCNSLNIVFVPGPDEGFRMGSKMVVEARGNDNIGWGTKDELVNLRKWLLRNILIPCCHLIPACKSITLCGSLSEARALQATLSKNIFPKNSTISYPRESYLLKHIIKRKSNAIKANKILG